MVDGINTLEADVGALAQKAGYVYQDFENQIVRPTVLDDASYACLNYAMADYVERGKEALTLCGLKGREDDYIWQLSGGQTHLLALAGAVSLRPEVLILDEPIAQLDPGHADRIYQVLKELNEKHGKTIIVIEHHTEYIADYCKHVMLMRDGGIAWKLPTSQALRRVGELQECNIFPPQVTLAADKLPAPWALPWERPLPTTIPQGLEAFRGLAYRPVEQAPSPPPEQKPAPAVEFRQVSLSYRSVKGADRGGVRRAGPDHPQGRQGGADRLQRSGQIHFDEADGRAFKARLRGHPPKRGEHPPEKDRGPLPADFLVYQNPEQMFIKDSIRADIAFAMEARGMEHYKERTQELLSRFRLSPLQDRDGRLLSGGQMRRASLAIGVALNPGILLLDEPTANLGHLPPAGKFSAHCAT